MRKKILSTTDTVSPSRGPWLNLENLAQVEVSSEEPTHPVEAALLEGEGPGWRASVPGNQIIRILFDKPTPLRKIRLLFRENEVPRTQEFVLRWSADVQSGFHEIVRQQYNFAPPATCDEVEEFNVDLGHVAVLELVVTPDVSGGTPRASLKELRLA